jgi:hypothetical protein
MYVRNTVWIETTGRKINKDNFIFNNSAFDVEKKGGGAIRGTI